MRLSPAIPGTLAVLALVARSLPAQQGAAGSAPRSTPPATPYGAASVVPVSKWTPPASAGRQLTIADLLAWKSLRFPQLSNDGKWFAYVLAPNEGDAEVVIRPTTADAKEWRYAAGDAAGDAAGGGRGGALTPAPVLSGNGRWAAFIEHPSAATAARENGGRGGRAGGGNGNGVDATARATKLAVVDLSTGLKREFERVRSFRFAGEKSDWIAIHHSAPEGAAATAGTAASTGAREGLGGPGGSTDVTGTMLELANLGATGATAFIGDVSEFSFDESGDWLAYAISVSDQVGNGVQLRQLSTGVVRALDARKASYRRLVWGDSSDALAVLRTVSDTSGGDEEVTAVAWRHAANAQQETVEINARTSGVSGGLVVSSDRALEWGDQQKTLYLGLREPRPPRPRTQGAGFTPASPGGVAPGAGNTGQVAAAPQTDAEVPSLILWHWKDPRLQSQQQVQEVQDRAFAYLAEYTFASGRVTQLADRTMRDVAIGPKDSWGVGTDISAYEREQNIKGSAFHDLYAVNITTGERKPIQMKVPGTSSVGGGRGGTGVSNFAPDNTQYVFYDSGEWKVYDFNSASSHSITSGVPAKFWNTEDDHNQRKPPIGGALVGWSRDGKNVFVRDNWDVWRLPTSGSGAVNITGNGQSAQIRYQARLLFDPRDRGVDLDKPLFFKTYGEWTKNEGLSQVDPVQGGAKVISWEAAKVDYRRARDAQVWVYSRQTIVKYPDWYAADSGLKNERRLTEANPQQKDVAWTPGARLIDYTCDNGGGKHQAVLYLPAGYEPGKKYPMLTYIYEKLSQEFNVYSEPNATRYSNPSVFTSRGYAFLKPDIVYHLNDPGRSAVWCVVPAVKAAIATGLVDPARVGLQGHSWGGYQTAFITTQTKIFRTAVAGAPLTDMVSMAGSVYWNSGAADNAIFIASQGRFTGGPNDVPDAYTRNSPQQFAQNLSNPLMILHDDRDGAVDFNQGITYYNHLRNLGKDVVLLEYVGENHGLARAANQKDYALRMTEWFDTFLRDQAPPDWLKDGVPRLKMEQHLRERRPLVDPKATAPPPKAIP